MRACKLQQRPEITAMESIIAWEQSQFEAKQNVGSPHGPISATCTRERAVQFDDCVLTDRVRNSTHHVTRHSAAARRVLVTWKFQPPKGVGASSMLNQCINALFSLHLIDCLVVSYSCMPAWSHLEVALSNVAQRGASDNKLKTIQKL
jgi:hypothetical protein